MGRSVFRISGDERCGDVLRQFFRPRSKVFGPVQEDERDRHANSGRSFSDDGCRSKGDARSKGLPNCDAPGLRRELNFNDEVYYHEIKREKRIHAYRVAGRHRDHRDLGSNLVPRLCSGKGGREENRRPEQRQAD